MIQSTTNCVSSATPVVAFRSLLTGLVAVGLSLSNAWSQSILELEFAAGQELAVQEPPHNSPPAMLDPFGLDSEMPVAQPSAQILIDDTQDEITPAEPVPAEDLSTPEQSEEGFDLLMRAPLHEAFAEIPLSAAVPNPIIARQPPEAIEELPPDYKPEGDNIVWISGYWFWDEEREDFIWVSGVWRDAPEGQQWMEGYWHQETDASNLSLGYRWVNGFWQSTQATTLNYLPQPPEAIEVGPSMPAPSEDYFYVPGSWMYQQSRYVWRPGYYSVYIEDLVWVPPCYVWTPCGYLFRPGYWDKPIHERGIVFAPVFFREPVYLQPNYFFRPTCTIDTGLALLPHLFVRRNRCHYYFGDWYADRYVQHDFCGWSNLGNHGFHHGQYDPLFNYYSSPLARFQNQSLVYWAGRQHRHCASNIGLRPPTVFNLTIVNQRFSNHQHNHIHNHPQLDVLPSSQVFLGDSLGRRAKVGSLNSLDRQAERFVRIDARQQKNELEAIDRQLQKQRRDAERQLSRNLRANSQNAILQPTQVPIVPTALTLDPERQARKEKEAIRRQETQLQIQQRQAEAAARAQARKLENDQRKMQSQLESQVRDQNRQLKRAERQGNPILNGLPQNEVEGGQPSLTGGQPMSDPAANESVDKRLERQLKANQRQQTLQLSQQEREQRKQMEAAQRQQESAQRQAAEALKRQQRNGQILGNQPLNSPSTNGQIDNQIQRQLQNEERLRTMQMKQQERDQRKQIEAVQRQQESAQRQAAEALKRQQRNGQILGNQPLNSPSTNGQIDNQIQRQLQNEERLRTMQMKQQERDQRQQMEAAQRQQEAAQRQAEVAQRQAAESMKRQQMEQMRHAQEAIRQQQSQQAAQQRQLESQQRQNDMMRRQAEAQQRQAQEAGQRAAEKAQRDQERQQRQQEREKKKD